MTRQLHAEAIDAEFIAPDPVGNPLALAMLAHLRRYLVLRRDDHFVALALWVLFTHAHDFFSVSPILAITSATMREGKSRLLEVIQGLVPNPLSASNSTPAGIFRAIERGKPTVVEDEADTFIRRNPELRGILNSSFNRANAYVLRADGPHSTWAPIAIGLIGDLPPTLHDRAIVVRMQRKLPSERVERLRLDDAAFAELKLAAATWIASRADALTEADPAIPDGLNDRQADAWRPLFAIADQLGGDWPRRVRDAAAIMSKEAVVVDVEDFFAELITDISQIFENAHLPRIATRDLVQALVAMPERPWATANHGRPISDRYLSHALRRFGVVPKEWQEGPPGFRQHRRGYVEADLLPILARYGSPGTRGTSGTPS